eukprot:CAMPEP_0168743224 /NCGR_PEP_ID=MMETSP0724-20121128/13458_1 /TAXON_ID=265536 /ORGANISM="Amphiprora sp., Strain CCMP467" /LENGTH=561 /DNA_ID=CAMNT_0008790831 /DNA_START=14 /DNA_END=1699 /DNA_ORIENTATION=+
MEDPTAEGNIEQRKEAGSCEETSSSIRRTQSSLELLSDTALAAMGANPKEEGSNEQEHEEACLSDGSGDTSGSARVTPSLSQSTSQASMGIGATTTTASAASTNHSGAAVAGGEEAAAAATPKTEKRVIPTSPYRGTTVNTAPAPSAMTYAELPGLPIEHYAAASRSAAFAVPTPQRMYLPETYLPQPPPEAFMHQHPHFFHPGVVPPPMMAVQQQQQPHTVTTTTTAASGGRSNPATHAAFVPPRSSVARASTEAPPPYPAFSQPRLTGGTTHHYMVHHHHHPPPPPEQQQQPPNARLTQPPVNPCESFTSDSTASLVSESKYLIAPKVAASGSQLNLHQQHHGETPVINNLAKGGGDTDLAEDNQKLRQENIELKHELEKRDKEITVLRGEVRELDLKVKELRQFPAGKISQIPMADMLEIMSIYGSEVSETVMPPRKLNIQKASVIRQFRRWNPNFLKFFYFKDGKWEPKLGREGELTRRQQTRKKGPKQSSAVVAASIGSGNLSPVALVQQLHSSPLTRAPTSPATPEMQSYAKPSPPSSNRKRKATDDNRYKTDKR